jgi:YidC/Oxa1 family membrane protein insertase
LVHLVALAAFAVFDNPWTSLINGLAGIISTVLDFINAHVTHNYGWSMVALAFVATLAMLPLYLQTFRSVKEMQAIQPYIKRLQEKYKADRQKLAEEQMKLFREHNINPLGGCLPTLVQLPIFFAIYTAIRSHAPQFAHATWMWIGSALAAHSWVFPAWIPYHLLSGPLIASNLGQSDKILTLLYSVSMFFSFQMTTTVTTDPAAQQQQKMMSYLMPVMWFFIGQNFPSGFTLYWLSLNAFSTTIRLLAMRAPSRIPAPPKETPATLAGYPLHCPKCDALLAVVKGSKCASCGVKVKKLASAGNGQLQSGASVAPVDKGN